MYILSALLFSPHFYVSLSENSFHLLTLKKGITSEETRRRQTGERKEEKVVEGMAEEARNLLQGSACAGRRAMERGMRELGLLLGQRESESMSERVSERDC